MTWKPISTAPKDRPIDLWCRGQHYLRCEWNDHLAWWVDENGALAPDDATHWKYPDKGPGQEEGEARWMMEVDGMLKDRTYSDFATPTVIAIGVQNYGQKARVVRVRIVREEG